MKCIFCDIDHSKIENTIIEETENFIIMPTLGSLVDGYILIVAKRHINSMSELNDNELVEYNNIIERYKKVFKKIYNKPPIIFEHGSPNKNSAMKANSVTHAHTHLVNHNFKNEKEIIKKYNFEKINKISEIKKNINYIKYINENNNIYVSYNFPPISQLIRILIAKELGLENKYDWKTEIFQNNIELTIKKLKDNI